MQDAQGGYGACTRPAPTSVAGNGRCLAVDVSLARNAIPRRLALLCAHKAAQPATCGVAMLVPLMVLCNCGRGHDENTFTPGPAISTLPPSENDATRSELSSAATETIVGEFAGAPAGLMMPGRELELPAAATIRQPAPRAAAPAAV